MLRRLIAVALALTLGASPLPARQDVSPEQIKALKQQIAGIDRWLTDAEKDRSSLEQELTATERKISALTRDREALRKQAQDLQARLSGLREKERELTATLEKQRISLKNQVRAAWMEGDAPALKVLLNEIKPGEIARTLTYYEYLSKNTVARLEAFQSNLQALKTARQDAQATSTRLAKTEADLEQRRQELASSRQQRQQTLAALKADIRSRRSERETLEADRKRLEQLLEEVQQAIANIPAPNESNPFKSLRDKLPWPARGKVVSNYGATYADGKLRRSGILLNTAEGAEIKSVHYGRVVFANWLRGFGLMTIIDHGDGYMSLYGHSSSLFTEPGDWVSPGDTIALAGRTGGTEDPALYFEVRRNGKPVNPRSWLGKL
ncbi:murein hydrolase activator EnvC family protein [Marinobacter fuscus]|uniref:murein hydrolase activator EnvC family protein n=1 Tax=Marinobacter fuscus TaxID=2109942 RepID=UPI001F0BC1F2|nr:peptidoglycan DD-metalloendopeptidase family protein [Marinobacter fuscus]